jgi:nitrite reductase/ring-hydroxylating ferredoxin subunit
LHDALVMEDWTPTLALDALPDRRPTMTTVAGTAVLLVRNGEDVFAIGNRCTHMGAPLAKGPVTFAGSLRTVRCPLHGSTFDLSSGRVMKGPATEPVPAFETRVAGGVVQIRARDDG